MSLPRILESGLPFHCILPKKEIYFRYIGDDLLIHLHDTSLAKLVESLNRIEQTINFIYEMVTNYTLSYLEVILIRTHKDIQLKVYRKPTNNNDLIHICSNKKKKKQNK